MTNPMPLLNCDRCNDQLAQDQIGLCDKCQADRAPRSRRVKTADLTGAALDWVVAICQHVEIDERHRGIWFESDDCQVEYSPSCVWAQGGPIIERERIDVDYSPGDKEWRARWFGQNEYAECWSPTPLIAAMRCYVASKRGDEVDVPKELL